MIKESAKKLKGITLVSDRWLWFDKYVLKRCCSIIKLTFLEGMDAYNKGNYNISKIYQLEYFLEVNSTY